MTHIRFLSKSRNSSLLGSQCVAMTGFPWPWQIAPIPLPQLGRPPGHGFLMSDSRWRLPWHLGPIGPYDTTHIPGLPVDRHQIPPGIWAVRIEGGELLKGHARGVHIAPGKLDLPDSFQGDAENGCLLQCKDDLATRRVPRLLPLRAALRPRRPGTRRLVPFKADFPAAMDSLVRRRHFVPGEDAAIVDRVATQMAGTDPEMALPVLRSLATLDMGPHLQRLHEAGVPITLINRADQPTDVNRLRAHHPGLRLVRFEGAGHFPMLTDPEMLTRLLTAQISRILKDGSEESGAGPER